MNNQEEERLLRVVWEMIGRFESPNLPVDQNMVAALMLGLRLHRGDSVLANAMFKVLVSDRLGEMISVSDALAGAIRKDFPNL